MRTPLRELVHKERIDPGPTKTAGRKADAMHHHQRDRHTRGPLVVMGTGAPVAAGLWAAVKPAKVTELRHPIVAVGVVLWAVATGYSLGFSGPLCCLPLSACASEQKGWLSRQRTSVRGRCRPQCWQDTRSSVSVVDLPFGRLEALGGGDCLRSGRPSARLSIQRARPTSTTTMRMRVSI